MPLKITGRHMTVSEATQDYIDKKVSRLRRLVPNIDEISFTFTKEKLGVDIEAKFKAGRIVAQARSKAEHVHETIDELVDKLEAQITKVKKKVSDKSNAAREAAKVDGKLADAENADEDEDEDEEDEFGGDETPSEPKAAQG
jgi:ribosomal subunit interface protein